MFNKQKSDFIPNMIECLDTIQKLTTRIVDRIDELSNENTNLQSEFTKLNKKSFAAVLTETAPSGSGPTLAANIPQTADEEIPSVSPHLPPELEKISTRVDQLEQDSLSDTLLLQGPAIEEIATHDAQTNGSRSSGLNERQRQHVPAALKQSLCNLLRPLIPNFSDDHISHLSILGKEKKAP